MDKFLGQEIPEKERWQFLQDNADAVEEIGYTHRFTPDELAQKKESLAETSIKINDIEIEKKEAMEAERRSSGNTSFSFSILLFKRSSVKIQPLASSSMKSLITFINPCT